MRTSPIYYIAPSDISVIPNANNSPNDLAVYIARNAKIKVLATKAGIGTSNANFQEWTISGRNRRLADSAKPYTIYARLPKNDRTGGYLVFAPMVEHNGELVDKYPYLTLEGVKDTGSGFSAGDNWYIRLGDVHEPVEGQRTLEIDTGILGTDAYNSEWLLQRDELPLRVEVNCTIQDEDAGPTPYVYWGQTLTLTAMLKEGWADDAADRLHHWEITRHSGDDNIDASWPAQGRADAFAESGMITLSHARGVGDDFNGAFSTIFTITAYGSRADESSSGSDSSDVDELVVLATGTVTIMAEVVEKFELKLSTSVVSYNPTTQLYNPQNGVAVRIRATDQRGNVFDLTNGQLRAAGLSVRYAPVGSQSEIALVFSGTDVTPAAQSVPVSAFASQKSVNVRLVDAAQKELHHATIAFVRDGEDSHEREWIFMRSATALTFGTGASEHLPPSRIELGEVNPLSVANGDDDDKDQEGWVPNGWYDEQLGSSATYPYEYGAYRDYVHTSDGGHWGSFSTPTVWSHYGEDAVGYAIMTDRDQIVIASDVTSAIVNITASFVRTVGATSAAHACYYGFYRKNGNSYTRFANAGDTRTAAVSLPNISVSSVITAATYADAIVIYITESPQNTAATQAAAPATYLARKEIPVLKNGDTGPSGEDALVAMSVPTSVMFQCNASGRSVESSVKEVVMALYKGADSVDFDTTILSATNCTAWETQYGVAITTGAAWSNGTLILYTEKPYPYLAVGDSVFDADGVTIGTITDLTSSYIRVNGMNINYTELTGASYRDLSAGGSVEVALTYHNVSRIVVIPVNGNRQGDTGAPGSAGPMLYPAGRWKAVAYTASGNSRPYVLYVDSNGDSRYYYLNTTSAAASDVPGTSDKWSVLPQLEVVAAKYGILDYGQIASAVLCGDWMYSQYGRLYLTDDTFTDVHENNYMEEVTLGGHTAVPFAFFNVNYPQGGHAHTFAPTWAVNMKTGAQYGAGGAFRADADGVHIVGTLELTNGLQDQSNAKYGKLELNGDAYGSYMSMTSYNNNDEPMDGAMRIGLDAAGNVNMTFSTIQSARYNYTSFTLDGFRSSTVRRGVTYKTQIGHCDDGSVDGMEGVYMTSDTDTLRIKADGIDLMDTVSLSKNGVRIYDVNAGIDFNNFGNIHKYCKFAVKDANGATRWLLFYGGFCVGCSNTDPGNPYRDLPGWDELS